MIRYLCPREMLPTVEAALAADGYKVEQPHSNRGEEDHLLVMSQQSAVVLLCESARSEMAVIEVFGAAKSAVAELLESLPVSLVRKPLDHERQKEVGMY